MPARSTLCRAVSIGRLALVCLALVTLAGACAPKTIYDPGSGALSRTDGAFKVPISIRQRALWQIEIPGVGSTPKRYAFDYDAIVYRIRAGQPGSPPDAVVVLSARSFPETVRTASLAERGQKLFEFVQAWMTQQGFSKLADDRERFFFDGRTLTATFMNAEEPLSEPGMGVAFLFGNEYILEALYEIYPASQDEAMSAKELQETLKAVGTLLLSTEVR